MFLNINKYLLEFLGKKIRAIFLKQKEFDFDVVVVEIVAIQLENRSLFIILISSSCVTQYCPFDD